MYYFYYKHVENKFTLKIYCIKFIQQLPLTLSNYTANYTVT